jgi:hypothetical protein
VVIVLLVVAYQLEEEKEVLLVVYLMNTRFPRNTAATEMAAFVQKLDSWGLLNVPQTEHSLQWPPSQWMLRVVVLIVLVVVVVMVVLEEEEK